MCATYPARHSPVIARPEHVQHDEDDQTNNKPSHALPPPRDDFPAPGRRTTGATDAALAAKAGGFVADARTARRAYRSEPGHAVWIATDLTPAQTAHAVLHEARHRWQAVNGLWTGRGGEAEVTACEFDAEGFAIAHREEALASIAA